MTNVDKFIARGMSDIKAAIAAAPSHDEILAGLEAMMRHLLAGPHPDDDHNPVQAEPVAPAAAVNETSTTSAA